MQEFGIGNFDQSFVYLQQCSLLKFVVEKNDESSRFLKEKERICVLSYNFGLEAVNNHKFDDAIRWLTFGFDYAKQMDLMDKSLLVRLGERKTSFSFRYYF